MNDMLKGKSRQPTEIGQETPNGEPQLRDNPRVNAKIDDYIKNNPKHWDYIQALPPQRMARALVLNEVQKLERQEKIRDSVMRKLEQNPELKQAYETLVKNLPEDQKERVMLNIAGRTMRSITPRQTQGSQGVKV
jgi:hypothetical protein